MYKKPVLSICIPTYNRKEILKEILNELLRYPDDDIEIIIIDNASTDGTKDFLCRYRDSRMKIQYNEENIGMPLNQVKAIFSGSGKYTMALMDRDMLDARKLVDLISDLRQTNAQVIFLDYTRQKHILHGGEALSAAMFITHPSLVIYNTKVLHYKLDINVINKLILDYNDLPYAYTGVIGMYLLSDCPHAIILSRDVITLDFRKVRSYTQYGMKNEITYYQPDAAIKRYRKYRDILKEKNSIVNLKQWELYLYMSEFYRGVEWNYIGSHDKYTSKKYKIKRRTMEEYFAFYKAFIKQAIELMREDNYCSIKNVLIMNVISGCFLYRVYCWEYPFRQSKIITRISDKILSLWRYTRL